MTTDRETEIAAILAGHEWSPEHAEEGLTTAHNSHSYHFACAICLRDLDAIAAVLAAYITDREAEAWDAACEDHFREGDDPWRSVTECERNPFRFTPDTEGETGPTSES